MHACLYSLGLCNEQNYALISCANIVYLISASFPSHVLVCVNEANLRTWGVARLSLAGPRLLALIEQDPGKAG